MDLFKKIPSIDKEMIPCKITLFLTDGYWSAVSPFMNVFYVSIGLSATQAGLISGISLLVSSFFNPLWSSLADATGYRKLIFTIMCVGSAVTVFPMPWVEKLIASEMSNKNHSSTNLTNFSYHPPKIANIHVLFYALLAMNIIGWIFLTSVRCYVDGLVMNVVNTGTKKRSYGSQRLFSSLGYALISFLTGIIIDSYHPQNMSPYTASFYVYLPCILCLIPWGCKLIQKGKWEVNNETKENENEGMNMFQLLFSAFMSLDFIIFFFSVIVSGITLNVFNCFFFLLMDHEMKSSKKLMTFSIVVSVVFEVTCFAASKKIIKFCGGTIPAFIIGIFSFFPRFLFMSYIQNPWFVLLSQPLHGLGMGLAWSAAIDHTYNSFPAETRVTAIALMSSIEFMGSNALSNMVGGVLYDIYGGRSLFRGSGIIAAVWCVFMTIYYGIRHRQKKSKTSVEVENPPEVKTTAVSMHAIENEGFEK